MLKVMEVMFSLPRDTIRRAWRDGVNVIQP
jgi:hypothetical protein